MSLMARRLPATVAFISSLHFLLKFFEITLNVILE